MIPEPNETERARLLQVEAQRWSDLATQRRVRNNWLHSPLVLRHINTLVTGDPDKAWPEAAMERFFPLQRRGGRGLSLGCNDAGFESAIVRTGVCASFDCYDISADAIAAGRAAALKEGLPMHFHVADVNTLELPGERFSLAIVIMALHHVERLEDVCRRIHGALRRDGLFAFDEFVGPMRFQWTKTQVDAANELRRRLPAELRRLPDGRDAGDVAVPDIGRMCREEPFEAIRSDEIMPIVRDTFRVLVQRDYGGAALALALEQILVNFDEADPQHAAVLQGLCDQERRWVDAGALPSNYTVVVAARRDADPAVLGM